MKRILQTYLLLCALFGVAEASVLWREDFEGLFPPVGWTESSVDQSSAQAFNNSTNSARLGAAGDYLITPPH